MAEKQRIFFIINPFSGYNKKENIPQLLEEYLDQRKFTFAFSYTESKGHATVLAQNAVKEGYDIVVACGGDGTVNEVAKALVHTKCSLGIIPSGSGNGFAMHIGMGRNTKKAILKLNEATPRVIDSCKVNEEFFINLAGVGFDALIAYKASNDEKRGFQMYLSMVSKEVAKFKAENLKVEIDDDVIEAAFTTVAVANSAMYGYNFTVAPLAHLSDGLLDVVFIKEASILRTISSSWRMLTNSLNKSPLVDIRKCKKVKISAERPYYYHIDGESFEFDQELTFEIIPSSISVLFPKDSKILQTQLN